MTGTATTTGALQSAGVSSSANINATGTAGYQVGGTTVIDANRNLTNVGTVGCGALTSSGSVSAAGIGSSADINATGTATYKVGGTTVVDASRNLTNIGSVTCGAVTSTGNLAVTGSGSLSGSLAAAGVTSSSDVNVTGAGRYQVGGTTVIDASRNLTNVGNVSCGSITAVGTLAAAGV